MRRCALVVAAALMSVTALAGCGSADDAASEAPDDSSSSSSESSEEPSPDDDKSDKSDKDDKSDTDDKSDKSDKSGKGDTKPENAKKDSDEGKKKDSDDADDKGKNVNAAYCNEVKGMMSTFDPSNSASLANATDMDAIVNQFGAIADVAPANVRSDWSALTSAYGTLAAKLNKFHVDLTDPKGLSKLNRKQQQVIQKAIAKTQKVAPSVQAIESNIKRTCGVSMR